jgi:hypothetical protein
MTKSDKIAEYSSINSEPPEMTQPKRREVRLGFKDSEKHIYDWIVSFKPKMGLDVTDVIKMIVTKAYNAENTAK